MKSRTVFWLIAALLVLAVNQKKRWNSLEVFDWDAGGYFSYLPAAFIYDDPGRPDILALRVQQRLPEAERHVEHLGIHRLANGRYTTKYPLGVALSQLPWFAGAHLYSHLRGLPPDGAFWPYQQAAMLAGLAYALLGLWVVRQLLRRYYPDAVVAWTLAGIGLGTNYFVYASHEAALSHAVLFLWQAALLYCTARWYEAPARRWALGMGLFWGLATLTRFSEAIYGLVPLLWGLSSGAAWRQRPALWARHAGQLAPAAALGLAVVSLQFIFWRVVGGHWVLDGYQDEHFDFGHPHIVEGLFSVRKGWLVYTPLVALLLLGGLPRLPRYVPAAVPVLLVFLPVLLYVTFSWAQWWYGWGFSTRPLVSCYPLLALPLGALLAARRPASPAGATARGLLGLCIILNMWQGWQYVNSVLPGDEMTAQIYKERFWQVPPLFPAAPTPPVPPPAPAVW